jgi:hypothetical protein
MNKYRITNPYNNIVRDCKSRTTEGQMLDIVTLGTYKSSDISKFKAPTYGECKYQHRMSEAGWNYGSKK